jgi:catechol 2,3-dioxygenase-like lactoylglutathione lyase family enzyme
MTVHVRYLVDDVEASIAFYAQHFGFTLLTNQAPAFADVQLGELRLLLSGPLSSAGRKMPDGTNPAPGGWNRIHFVVDDIEAEVERLRAAGVTFRSDIVRGPGGAQIVLVRTSRRWSRSGSTAPCSSARVTTSARRGTCVATRPA